MPHRPASPFAYRGSSRAGRSPSAMLVLHIIQHGENGCKVNPPSCRSIQTTFRRISDSACRLLQNQRGLSARTDRESPSTVMLNSFPQNRHTVSTAESRSPPLRVFLFPRKTGKQSRFPVDQPRNTQNVRGISSPQPLHSDGKNGIMLLVITLNSE